VIVHNIHDYQLAIYPTTLDIPTVPLQIPRWGGRGPQRLIGLIAPAPQRNGTDTSVITEEEDNEGAAGHRDNLKD
jgi:hypothetical protein